jgi:hypothetical protein
MWGKLPAISPKTNRRSAVVVMVFSVLCLVLVLSAGRRAMAHPTRTYNPVECELFQTNSKRSAKGKQRERKRCQELFCGFFRPFAVITKATSAANRFAALVALLKVRLSSLTT